MSTNRNIVMNYFNGIDYDTLYPQTLYSNITDIASNTYTQSQIDNMISEIDSKATSASSLASSLNTKIGSITVSILGNSTYNMAAGSKKILLFTVPSSYIKNCFFLILKYYRTSSLSNSISFYLSPYTTGNSVLLTELDRSSNTGARYENLYLSGRVEINADFGNNLKYSVGGSSEELKDTLYLLAYNSSSTSSNTVTARIALYLFRYTF